VELALTLSEGGRRETKTAPGLGVALTSFGLGARLQGMAENLADSLDSTALRYPFTHVREIFSSAILR
jgi:hypothetical protein